MSTRKSSGDPTPAVDDFGCATECSEKPTTVTRDVGWHRAARWARGLAVVSLTFVLVQGGIGVWQGLSADSIALTGWALGSAPEALGSIIVIWRFSGWRTLSEIAERRAQRGVAVSFWLTAPYIATESIHHFIDGHEARPEVIGIILTAVALVQMPILGRAQHALGKRLGSAATVGKGTQNYLCAAEAAAVLIGLAVTATWPPGWWLDPAIGLGIAAAATWQGIRSWRGQDCGC
ncbi:cation transporter [Mycobacterium asiaticum]|uniref:cation transporter n=1 Tax=Mycobacterium asiaticum TaxID=1790 RepID=UPI0009BE6058|nr:cation transporter [Mycobacterium asiaticum]